MMWEYPWASPHFGDWPEKIKVWKERETRWAVPDHPWRVSVPGRSVMCFCFFADAVEYAFNFTIVSEEIK